MDEKYEQGDVRALDSSIVLPYRLDKFYNSSSYVDLSKFQVIEKANESNALIYSSDGEQLQVAQGCWQKFLVYLEAIRTPEILDRYREEAIIKIFEPRLKSFITALHKVEIKNRGLTYVCDSEWRRHPNDYIHRHNSLQELVHNISYTSLPENKYQQVANIRLDNIRTCNALFFAAQTASRYMQRYVFARIALFDQDGKQKQERYYIGNVHAGMPHGPGQIQTKISDENHRPIIYEIQEGQFETTLCAPMVMHIRFHKKREYTLLESDTGERSIKQPEIRIHIG